MKALLIRKDGRTQEMEIPKPLYIVRMPLRLPNLILKDPIIETRDFELVDASDDVLIYKEVQP